LALEPTIRTVLTTIIRITASMTAYSAMSCPLSSVKIWRKIFILDSRKVSDFDLKRREGKHGWNQRALTSIANDCDPKPAVCQNTEELACSMAFRRFQHSSVRIVVHPLR
jgi:hypothetical protein